MGFNQGATGAGSSYFSIFKFTLPSTIASFVPFTVSSAGNGGLNNSIRVLENGAFVYANSKTGGTNGAAQYAIYNSVTSLSPSIISAYTNYCTNIYGDGVINDVIALKGNNFAIHHNYYILNVTGPNTLISTFQYISGTTWINTGSFQPYVQYASNIFAGSSIYDSDQELLVTLYPTNNINGEYAPMLNVMEGRNLGSINNGLQRTYLPYPTGFTDGGTPGSNPTGTGHAYRAIILNDKRIGIIWRDPLDSNKGKFVIYQIPHFKTTISGSTATIKNNTGITQNVTLSAIY